MSDYILDVKSQTSKVDWAFPFQRTGPFPLDRSSVFSSLEDAQKYASGAADERQLSGSSYVGQIISVYTIENEVPTVGAYIISPARTLMKLAATTTSGDLSGDIVRLEQLINGKASTDYVNQELNKKANSDNVYSKKEVETYVAQQIAGAGHLKRVVVEQLPEVSTAQANTIYMIKKASGGIASWGKNIYEEYMVIEGEWELLGNSQVDLTDYASTTYVDNAVKNKVDKDGNKVLSTNDYTTAEKNKLANIAAGAEVNVNADWNATSGDAQILNKPTLGSMAAKSSVAKSDLASGVQTSLGKADSALQPGDISAWAKASTKPTYTASEVGAIPAPTDVKVGQYFKVSSVANGKITGIEAVDPWILSDEVTGTKYKLSVVKGKLTMTESEV